MLIFGLCCLLNQIWDIKTWVDTLNWDLLIRASEKDDLAELFNWGNSSQHFLLLFGADHILQRRTFQYFPWDVEGLLVVKLREEQRYENVH